MDNHFYVKNANNEIIINDSYQNFSFLGKFVIKTSTIDDRNFVGGSSALAKYTGEIFLEIKTSFPDIEVDEYPNLDKKVIVFNNTHQEHLRRVDVYPVYDDNGHLTHLRILAGSEIHNDHIDILIYTFAKRTPSKLGLLIYNKQGEIVFDALKGFLQVTCGFHYRINMYGSSVKFELPNYANNLPVENMYVSLLNGYPILEIGGSISSNIRIAYPQIIKENGKVYILANIVGGGTNGYGVIRHIPFFSGLIAYYAK